MWQCSENPSALKLNSSVTCSDVTLNMSPSRFQYVTAFLQSTRLMQTLTQIDIQADRLTHFCMGVALCVGAFCPNCYHKVGATDMFCRVCVERLDWPAQIPDLNTIKHIWDQFDLPSANQVSSANITSPICPCPTFLMLLGLNGHKFP